MVPIVGLHRRSSSDSPDSVGSLEVIQEALLASARREETMMLAHDEQQRKNELRIEQMLTSNAELQSSFKTLMLSNAEVQADLKLLKAELKAESTAAEDPATNNTNRTAQQPQTAKHTALLTTAPTATLAATEDPPPTPPPAAVTSARPKTSLSKVVEAISPIDFQKTDPDRI